MFDAAKRVVVRKIIELIGKDVPDPIAHERYLLTLRFAQARARLDQLLNERQPELGQPKRERVELQLELGMQEGRKP